MGGLLEEFGQGGGEAARGCKRHAFLIFSSFGSSTCLQRAVADL